jgi:ribosomal protein S18 acetylase RimI-like enzyme
MEDYDPLMSIWDGARLTYKPRGRDRRDKIEREIKGLNAVFLVAEIEGKLVGSVFATHDGRKGWINRLAVSPAFRRRGIAQKLVREAEGRLAERGIEIVACLIEDANAGSKRFFESIGYQRFDDISYFTKRKYPGA